MIHKLTIGPLQTNCYIVYDENTLQGMIVDPACEDKQITALYKLFEVRVDAHEDATADIYKNAIKSDGETLRAWGLLK